VCVLETVLHTGGFGLRSSPTAAWPCAQTQRRRRRRRKRRRRSHTAEDIDTRIYTSTFSLDSTLYL
jgi:hypothetical protein